jgi:hypothetical protein
VLSDAAAPSTSFAACGIEVRHTGGGLAGPTRGNRCRGRRVVTEESRRDRRIEIGDPLTRDLDPHARPIDPHERAADIDVGTSPRPGGIVIQGMTHYHTIYCDKTYDYGGTL